MTDDDAIGLLLLGVLMLALLGAARPAAPAPWEPARRRPPWLGDVVLALVGLAAIAWAVVELT